MDMALYAKDIYEESAQRAELYNRKIDEIKNEIDRLYGKSSFGSQKRKNYAKIKVKEPPSDIDQ